MTYQRKPLKREILISQTPYDKRIAIMENGELSELVTESSETTRILGNIYKGVVQKVLPGLQAAFVEIGLEKAGFLHADDVLDRNIQLRKEFGDDENEQRRKKEELPSIDQLLKEGDEIMVQVTKEPISTKGARLTTHLTFPGRFLVCMPGTNFIGVSKRERDHSRRRELKQFIRSLKSDNVGFIVRTNGLKEDSNELSKQLRSLEAKWEATQEAFDLVEPRSLVHMESSAAESTLRDYFSDNTDFVYVDSKDDYRAMRTYLRILSPDKMSRIRLWSSKESLFDHFGVEAEYERMMQKEVRLRRGGSLVIEQTEALVSIDVNTGPKVQGKNQGKNILETNLDAANEIARQMRLRDIGGLIIIDFIDMDNEADKESVINEFKKAIRKDKTPISFLPLSQFGLMEVTRKRVRMNILTEKTSVCPTCSGRGSLFSLETILSNIDRWFARMHQKSNAKKISLALSTEMVNLMLENRGMYFKYLEDKYGLELELLENETAPRSEFHVFETESMREITSTFALST